MMAAIARSSTEPIRVCSIARPEAQAGQVLVRIHASGVNPLDAKIYAGAAAHARHPLPAILGLDLAGVVEAVGSGVERFRRGDEVYGMTGGVGGHRGTLAQFAAVDADLLAIKPTNLSMRESAALPLVFITSWEGLVDRAAVRANQTVLIHGGSGGIGHIAVQLAKSLGAQVFATGSERQRDQIEGLGATFIDYVSEQVTEYVDRCTGGAGFDVILDTVGGKTLDASFAAVRHFGHVVSALGWGTHALAPLSFRAATYSGIFTLLPLLTNQGRAHHGDILSNASRLVEEGKVKPILDPRRFTLDSIGEAYQALTNRTARGRLVVDIGNVRALGE
jgi:NADPH:quinone reductase-like Zn-dependent oxidoreductase